MSVAGLAAQYPNNCNKVVAPHIDDENYAAKVYDMSSRN